jgi:hypothetical protein
MAIKKKRGISSKTMKQPSIYQCNRMQHKSSCIRKKARGKCPCFGDDEKCASKGSALLISKKGVPRP